MFNLSLSKHHPVVQLIILLGIISISLAVFFAFTVALFIFVFNINFFASPNLLNLINQPDGVFALKVFQLINHLSVFLIPSVLFGYIAYKKNEEFIEHKSASRNVISYFNLNNQPTLQILIIVGLIILSSLPFVNWMATLNSYLKLPELMSSIERFMTESQATSEQMVKAFLRTDGISSFLFNIILIAVVPALGEEMLFRGIFQPIFTQWSKNKHLGVWITAFLFSAIHMQLYNFIPIMLLGALLGYLLLWSNSLWLPIAAHFFNNAMAVVVTSLIAKGYLPENAETIGSGSNELIYSVISTLVLFFLIYICYQKLKQSREASIVISHE